MKRIFWVGFLVACLPCLEACVPTAFVAGAAASGAVIYDNRSIATMAEDKNITYRAQAKLNENKDLSKKAHVSVMTFNRVVLAVGQTPTSELRDTAISIIQHIPNVERIYNEITIEDPISITTSSNDAWLTTKVKTALLGEKSLHASQIKILTENKIVYLMGLVTHGQGDTAAEVTRNVKGVKGVVKVFEYLN